jgi:transposase
LCNRDGCPIAIQVFDGNTADPRTLADQVAEVKQRFALARAVFVGDRGVVTSARIRADLQPVGLDWITALRAAISHTWPQTRAVSTPSQRARHGFFAIRRKTLRSWLMLAFPA